MLLAIPAIALSLVIMAMRRAPTASRHRSTLSISGRWGGRHNKSTRLNQTATVWLVRGLGQVVLFLPPPWLTLLVATRSSRDQRVPAVTLPQATDRQAAQIASQLRVDVRLGCRRGDHRQAASPSDRASARHRRSRCRRPGAQDRLRVSGDPPSRSASGVPKRTITWLSTTSFSTCTPGSRASRVGEPRGQPTVLLHHRGDTRPARDGGSSPRSRNRARDATAPGTKWDGSRSPSATGGR